MIWSYFYQFCTQNLQSYNLLIRKYNIFLSKVIILLTIILTTITVFFLKDSKFDYGFEHFFPSKDKELAFYKAFTKKFETDNDFLLIGLKSNQGVFDSVFLQKVQHITDTLTKTSHIEYVISPITEKRVIIGPLGPINIPYFHTNNPKEYKKDSIRIYNSGYMIGSLISEDGKSISLFVKTGESMPKSTNDSLLLRIEKIVSAAHFDENHIAGKIKGQYYFIDRMKKEMVLFIVMSLLLLIVFLYFAFQSVRGILLPLSVVIISALWIQATMVLFNKPITLMVTLMPTILFVVGISAVVHLFEKLIEEFQKGKIKQKALINTYKIVGKATILTCLTTATGFLSLTTSHIQPTIDFGIFTAVGVGFILVLIFTLVPAVIITDKKFNLIPPQRKRGLWQKLLTRLFPKILKNRTVILALSGFVCILAVGGILSLKVNNSFLEDYSENDERIQDYRFFENDFSGFRSFEMEVWIKDSLNRNLLSLPCLNELSKIETYLYTDYGCGFLTSPLTFVKTANRSLHGGNDQWYCLPKNEIELKKISSTLIRFISTKKGRKYITRNKIHGRISGKINDLGGYQFKILDAALDSFIETNIDTSILGYKVTGMGTMIDRNNEYISWNMIRGLLLAFGIVALLMAILYRNIGMLIIALIPNILPLIIIAGLMGYCGIDLKISTSIIFTIAFGIAVDDTIHFLTRFKVELSHGRSVLYALKRTFLSTGKAMIVTTCILCSGFICLLFSEITSTYYIGVLVGITLFIALICDLFLLPVLLLVLYRKN